MSKRSSSKTKRQGPAKEPQSTKELGDPSTTEISDTIERRRMQNRLAQRNHRKKVRDHIKALEARVINSMLQRPPPYVLPIPQAGQPHSSAPQPYPFALQSPEQHFRSTLDGNEVVESSYLCPRTKRSPSASSPSSDYPASPPPPVDSLPYLTPATSSISLPSLHPSPTESRTSGVTFEILPQHHDAQLEPLHTQRLDRAVYQNDSNFGNYVGFGQTANDLADFEYLSMAHPTSSSGLPQQCSATTSPMMTHANPTHSPHFLSAREEREWLNSISLNPSDHGQAGPLSVHPQYSDHGRYELPESNIYSVPPTPATIMSTAHHYFDETQSQPFPPSTPTENFHQSMAIYRSPKFGR